MKWKIRSMFETTNQPWECRLKLNSKIPLDGETPDERIFKMHKNARGQLQSKSGNVLVHHLCSLPSNDMVIVDTRFGNQTWLGNPQKFTAGRINEVNGDLSSKTC